MDYLRMVLGRRWYDADTLLRFVLSPPSSAPECDVPIMSEFIYPNNAPIALLKCEDAFNELTEKEKKYAHYLSRASWFGGLIVLIQNSHESPLIFNLLHKLFRVQHVDELKKVALKECNFTEDEFQAVLIYTCGILYNMGNYKRIGNTKFIPNVEKDKFKKLVLSSQFAATNPQEVTDLLSRCLEQIYSLDDKDRKLGFPPEGTTTYLSKNCTKEDDEIVKEFMVKHNIEAWNSRLFKTNDEMGNPCYEIRLASVLETENEEEKDLIKESLMNGCKFRVTRGDYSKLLNLVNENLLLAKKYAANENEEKMIEKFVHYFRTGSLNAHKDGSRLWVKDKGPAIESYIGFVESYKDPAGMRAEFQGFVAMVNKKLSAKFANLVASSETLVSILPWPNTYEKEKFLQPDFTAVDALTLAGGPPCVAVCLPQYDEIKWSEGFKYVFFGNILSWMAEPPNFLNKSDQEMVDKYTFPAFTVRMGLQLLGQLSGKVFIKRKDGSYNFDIQEVRNLDTNKEITSWYEEGETFSSIFGSISDPYENCRADCVALYLCDVPEILRIFSLENEADIIYSSWLEMALFGLSGLQLYDQKTKSWLGAHCRARYVIFRVLLEAGEDFIKVERTVGEDGKPDLLLTMDRTKIQTVGKPCLGEFLKKLQLYKSVADITSAKEMFDKYSTVSSEGKHPFLEYRDIVIARRKPPQISVQANTLLEGDQVLLKNYEETPEGVIQSYIDRFQAINVDNILGELWVKDKNTIFHNF